MVLFFDVFRWGIFIVSYVVDMCQVDGVFGWLVGESLRKRLDCNGNEYSGVVIRMDYSLGWVKLLCVSLDEFGKQGFEEGL